MTPGNALDREPTLFSAVLRPHRSLGATGLLILMLSLSAGSVAAGIIFLAMGAWPVVGFLALEPAIMFWAFCINYRDARAYEVVIVTPSELTLHQVNPHGAARTWTLNPRWVRLDRESIEDYGTQKLFVVSRGQRLPVANVLGPFEKDSFADALGAALADARRGPDRSRF